ncbi:MAG: 50S ribosomal protein L11 methyltransferase [Myxococcota bacterium]
MEVLALDFPELSDPVGLLTDRLQALETAGAIDQDGELWEGGGRAFGLFPATAPEADFGAARTERWILRPHFPWTLASVEPDLELRAEGAFGSGHHPTTAMMLDALRASKPKGRVLDVGTGTGVLALTALRQGASHAVATDISDAALASARGNAARNGLASSLALSRDLREAKGPFDLILANVRKQPLVDMAAELRARLAPRGRLLVSGLRFHEDRALCRALDLEPTQARLCQGWWQLAFGATPQRQAPA